MVQRTGLLIQWWAHKCQLYELNGLCLKLEIQSNIMTSPCSRLIEALGTTEHPGQLATLTGLPHKRLTLANYRSSCCCA